jgi:hypothetical protein
MAFLLQFCGLSDPLQIFYLEQRNATPAGLGPVYAGFRPFQLDALLDWALESARCRRWDGELIRHTVVDVWMERAEVIRQWQVRLRDEPDDRLLVAGLGSQQDWMHRCEQSLQA